MIYKFTCAHLRILLKKLRGIWLKINLCKIIVIKVLVIQQENLQLTWHDSAATTDVITNSGINIPDLTNKLISRLLYLYWESYTQIHPCNRALTMLWRQNSCTVAAFLSYIKQAKINLKQSCYTTCRLNSLGSYIYLDLNQISISKV